VAGAPRRVGRGGVHPPTGEPTPPARMRCCGRRWPPTRPPSPRRGGEGEPRRGGHGGPSPAPRRCCGWGGGTCGRRRRRPNTGGMGVWRWQPRRQRRDPWLPTPPPHELPPAAATGGPASMLSLPSSMSAEQPMSIPELLPSRELLSASIHGKGEIWAPSRAPRGGGAAGRRPLPAPPPWQRQWHRPPPVGDSSTCSAARRGGRARPAARWRHRR